MVTVYTLDFLIAVPGPRRPKHEFGPVCRWKRRYPVDAAVLPDSVPYLDVIGMGVFSESGRLGLFCSEKTLLLFDDLEQPPRRSPV